MRPRINSQSSSKFFKKTTEELIWEKRKELLALGASKRDLRFIQMQSQMIALKYIIPAF